MTVIELQIQNKTDKLTHSLLVTDGSESRYKYDVIRCCLFVTITFFLINSNKRGQLRIWKPFIGGLCNKNRYYDEI